MIFRTLIEKYILKYGANLLIYIVLDFMKMTHMYSRAYQFLKGIMKMKCSKKSIAKNSWHI